MKMLLRWLVLTLTILAIPQVISGVHVDTFGTALAAAAVMSILNLFVKPLVILFTLPLTILSLGFFLLVINALLFQFTGYLVSGFHVESFGSAFFAALIVSVVSWLLNRSTDKGQSTIKFVRTDSAARKVRDVGPL